MTADDRISLAALHLRRKDARAALKILDGLLALTPGHPRARFLRARCLRTLGQGEAAAGESSRGGIPQRQQRLGHGAERAERPIPGAPVDEAHVGFADEFEHGGW